jgi:protein O-GlcNAc transferase
MYRKKAQRLDTAFCQLVRQHYAPFTAHYADVAAEYYERRGQIEQALAEWRVAGRLNDEAVDSKACQALLKSVNATDEQRLAAQVEWARKHAIQADDQPALMLEPNIAARRITVGYVCAWWDSATIRGQAIPFIARHDRSRFRLIGYSLEPCAQDITQHFDEFRIIRQLSHRAFANLVRTDKVDALVEFTGFSPHHRYAAMGERCAPVQISYLNHTGTCGVANVDYVIADDIAAPAELDRFYTERIVRLPGTFFNFNYDWDQFPDSGPVPSLKTGFTTLGCFGSQSKINDAQIYMWAKLLQALPCARLFLRNRSLESETDRDFVLRRFTQWGVDPGRLRLEPGGDRYSILRDYRAVDISLDTWPYNGGNTIAESLWQGVPVITLIGNSFASRYGASLLKASGCEDLVARDVDELIAIAAALSADKHRLVRLRGELRQMMKHFGFADSDRFCKEWERTLERLVREALPASETRDG